MNRIDLFRMLSAVPLIGGLFTTPVVAAPATVIPVPLRTNPLVGVREILLTTLRMQSSDDIGLDIHIDFTQDHLVVKGWSFSKNRLRRFIITRESVQTGRYIDEFQSKLKYLIASLNDETGDGVAFTSMAHPPGLIDKMADAIQSGKLRA